LQRPADAAVRLRHDHLHLRPGPVLLQLTGPGRSHARSSARIAVTKPAALPSISPARALAVAVLVRVEEAGAFAAAALDAELDRRALDPRDAALATELVYGVLRAEGFLDDRIAALAARKTWT